MKKVAFAWVTEIIDFDKRDEAISFVKDNQGKGYLFTDYQPELYSREPYSFEEDYEAKMEEHYGKFVLHTEATDGSLYVFGNKDVSEFWSVEVKKPYGKYNTGW